MSDEKVAGSSIYVGNVPFGTTDESLTDLFADFSLESCKVIKTRSGRSRGFAIIKFADQSEADSAVAKYNESEFNGRKIYLKRDERIRGTPQLNEDDAIPTNVFITNIPYTATSKSLEETFGAEPGFKEATVGIDKRSGQSRGYAVLGFDSNENAKAAIEKLHKSTLDGRVISARMDYGSRANRTEKENIEQEEE